MITEGDNGPKFNRTERGGEFLYGAANNLRQGEPPVVLNISLNEITDRLNELALEVVLRKKTSEADLIPPKPLADIGSKDLPHDELLIIFGQLSANLNVCEAIVVRSLSDLRGFKEMLMGIRAKFESIKPLLKQEDLRI